jgi:hypothetical protein
MGAAGRIVLLAYFSFRYIADEASMPTPISPFRLDAGDAGVVGAVSGAQV